MNEIICNDSKVFIFSNLFELIFKATCLSQVMYGMRSHQSGIFLAAAHLLFLTSLWTSSSMSMHLRLSFFCSNLCFSEALKISFILLVILSTPFPTYEAMPPYLPAFFLLRSLSIWKKMTLNGCCF